MSYENKYHIQKKIKCAIKDKYKAALLANIQTV